MPKRKDAQIKVRIEGILQRYPNATSQDIRQRLMLTMKPSSLYPHFVPFYEQGRIDDRVDIQRAIRSMMKEHLGFSVIAQKLSNGRYNFLQVKQALIELHLNFNSTEQIKRCKKGRFGSEQPKDEHHHSQVVMYLQKKGHRLPDIWQVLRSE